MTRLDRHLVVALALIGLAALVPGLSRAPARAATAPLLYEIPPVLGPWTAAPSRADDVLPRDGRSLESLGRVYESGGRRLWVGIARYTGRNAPDTRPDLNAIVKERGLASMVRGAAAFPVDGAPALSTRRLTARFSNRTVTAWYWYRLGRRPVGSEYSLRFWLALNTLSGRDQPLFLVRVATIDDDVPGDFLRLLAPHLDRLAALAEKE